MNLASINFLQKLFLLHPWTQITWMLIIIIWILGVGPAIVHNLPKKTGHRVAWASSFGALLMLAVAAFDFPGNMAFTADKLVHAQPIKIVKVTHVTGSKNYVAETTHGKKYDVNQNQVSIVTADGQPTARLKHYMPNHDVTPEMIHAAVKGQMAMPKDHLELNVNPTAAKTTQTWHFKK